VVAKQVQNAWLPYETSPDIFHRLITETKIGRWCTYAIFKLVENDFLASLKQFNVPQTIPDHPLAVALSGALHVEPPGYLDSIREGKISVTEGALESLADREVTVRGTSGDSTIIETDHIVMATGYNLVGTCLRPLSHADWTDSHFPSFHPLFSTNLGSWIRLSNRSTSGIFHTSVCTSSSSHPPHFGATAFIPIHRSN